MNRLENRKIRIQKMYDCLSGFYDIWMRVSYKADIRLMAELLEITPEDHILDVGTGPGVLPVRFRKMGIDSPIWGIDLSPKQIERARRRAERLPQNSLSFHVGDMEKLPLPSEHFTKLTCVGALLLSENRHSALNEFHRVLRPGGKALIAEPKAEKVKKKVFYPVFNAFVKTWSLLRPELKHLSEEDFRGRQYFNRESLVRTVEESPLQLLRLEEDRSYYYCLCAKNGS